jgi:DNA adenine methylase
MNYPGGKNKPGVFHQIINLIPPHEVYIELFAGSAAVLRMKRLASVSYAIDIDPDAIAQLGEFAAAITQASALLPNGRPAVERSRSTPKASVDPVGTNTVARSQPRIHLLVADAIDWLTTHRLDAHTFIYCDPPYLASSRRQPKRDLYTHEFKSEAQLLSLLRLLKHTRANVIISGYPSKLYSRELAGWRLHTFTTTTRGASPATECLWMNYPPPRELHDYRYLGDDHRARLDFRRMRERWRRKLEGMPDYKRFALLAALRDLDSQDC